MVKLHELVVRTGQHEQMKYLRLGGLSALVFTICVLPCSTAPHRVCHRKGKVEELHVKL